MTVVKTLAGERQEFLRRVPMGIGNSVSLAKSHLPDNRAIECTLLSLTPAVLPITGGLQPQASERVGFL